MVYNYWKMDYWFNTRPAALPNFLLVILIIFGILLLINYFYGAPLFLKKHGGAYKKFISNLKIYSIVNGFFSISLAFCSWQLVPVLATRIWLIIWLLELILWGLYIFNIYKKKTIYLTKVDKSNQIKAKYLPKKK